MKVRRSILLLGFLSVLAATFAGIALASWLTADSSEQVRGVTPPSAYTLPKRYVRVQNGEQLAAALARTRATDIVLASGVYENARPFVNEHGHRIYSQKKLGAVLKAGITFGDNDGAGGGLVQGVRFDVSDPAKVERGIIWTWGSAGSGTRILDCTFNGNRAIRIGVNAYSPGGLEAERLVFRNFLFAGLRATDNKKVSYGESTPRIETISDISVDTVADPSPGASNGRGEAGLQIGHPVENGVQRIRVRNASWMGVELFNNAWDTTYSDLDIDLTGPLQSRGVGVYLERFAYRNVFERFTLLGVKTGFNAEWADPDDGGVAASHFTTIRDGVIDAAGASLDRPSIGVFLDIGTESTTVTGVSFRNQTYAAIGTDENIGTNVFEGNDYSGLAPGAEQIRTGQPPKNP
jgi:hypothetical protein